LPLSDIFTEDKAKDIVESYTRGTREDLQQSILRIVLPLKNYVREKEWNGIRLKIVEDCFKYNEEIYGKDIYRTLCIGCLPVEKISCNSYIDALSVLRKEILDAIRKEGKFEEIFVQVLSPNPDDFD
jgi:hypothetical protein